MADERWPALPSDGGFARLQREGLYVRELRFAHAVTETAPGHAALYTGAVPRATGIVSRTTSPAPTARSSRAWRCGDAAGAGGRGRPDRSARQLAGGAAGRHARRRAGRRAPGRRGLQLLAQGSRRAVRGAAATPRRCCGWTPRAARWSRRRRSRQAVPAWASLFADGRGGEARVRAGVAAARRGLAGVERGDARRPGGRGRLPGAGHRVSPQRDVGQGDARDAGRRSAAARARARRGQHAAETAAGAAGAAGAVAVVERLRRARVRSRQLGGVGRAAPARSRARRAARGAGRAGWSHRLRGDAHRRSRQLPAARDRAHRTGALVPAARAATPGSGRAAAARASIAADIARRLDEAREARRRRGRSLRLPDAAGQGAAGRRARGAAPADRCAVRRARRDRAGDRHADARPRPARRRRTSRCPR